MPSQAFSARLGPSGKIVLNRDNLTPEAVGTGGKATALSVTCERFSLVF
jgi:hypothetical protein